MSCLCFGCLGWFFCGSCIRGLSGPQSPGGVTLKPAAGSLRSTAAVIGFQGRACCAHCELEMGQTALN